MSLSFSKYFITCAYLSTNKQIDKACYEAFSLKFSSKLWYFKLSLFIRWHRKIMCDLESFGNNSPGTG